MFLVQKLLCLGIFTLFTCSAAQELPADQTAQLNTMFEIEAENFDDCCSKVLTAYQITDAKPDDLAAFKNSLLALAAVDEKVFLNKNLFDKIVKYHFPEAVIVEPINEDNYPYLTVAGLSAACVALIALFMNVNDKLMDVNDKIERQQQAINHLTRITELLDAHNQRRDAVLVGFLEGHRSANESLRGLAESSSQIAAATTGVVPTAIHSLPPLLDTIARSLGALGAMMSMGVQLSAASAIGSSRLH